MALSLLTKPSPSRSLLIARLHHASPASMGTARFSRGPVEFSKFSTLSQVGSHSLPFNGVAEHNVFVIGERMCFHFPPLRSVHSAAGDGNPLRKPSSVQVLGRISVCRHGCISYSGGAKQRCFCSSSGPINGPSHRGVENAGPMNDPYTQQATNRTYPYQQQPLHPTRNNMTHTQQQQQQPTYPASNNQQQQSTYSPGNQLSQQPRHAPHMGAPSAGTYTPSNQNLQQPGYAPPVCASLEAKVGLTGVPSAPHVSGNQNPQQPGYAPPSMSSTGPAAASAPTPPPPRTSAAAEVIDKYLGPSTLKLEKRDDKAPPPAPPPRRNYGPQGTQEKKSGKDLVAESAACAVIEKYLGPWPGFPPRDPKIDEYLDSLPENAACAAIDKYFGPYKPLFVFKKNEGDSNNPPPPSRPPRNRMMSRARNRAWNSSQQGASVDRPWMSPQQGSPADTTQGGQPPQSVGAPPSQGAASTPMPSQQLAGTMPTQPGAMPPHPGTMPTQMAPQSGASTIPPHGANMAPPHGAGFSPPGSNNS